MAAWYEEHKSYGGPEMNTETWYANHKNYTPSVAAWYEEHKSYGGPEMNTETWYANHKNYTPSVAAWYEEHKSYGGPEMNTETWYANHKNYTPSVAAWYEEHKSYGGPEMNTETWYANHKNYTVDTESWYAQHRNGSVPAALFERADMVRSVLLWEVVRSIEEHSLLKKLKAEKVQTLGKRSPSKRAGKAPVLQAAKQERLAVSTAERFNLEDWLAHEPHADFLSLADADAVKQGTEEGKMTSDVSRYLDSKTSRDLDTWLARETMGPAHEKGDSAAHDKSDSVLGKWLDRHASVNLGRWMQSFSRETTPLRARANARLAHRALAHEEAVLHQDAKHLQLSTGKLQSLQLAANESGKSGDPNSPRFDFETWWAELGKNESSPHWQSNVGGSNWTKMLPEPEAAQITASDSIGSGACCCGFACEAISNDCCGAWYPAGGGESYMHYGIMKQHPKSVSALSARAAAAHKQQRSAAALLQDSKARFTSLAQVEAKPLNAKAATLAAAPKASVIKPKAQAPPPSAAAKDKAVDRREGLAQRESVPTTKVAQAFGDRGFLGWMCQAAACTSAPVRVGATCEVECLSSDGVNCVQSRSCMDEAAHQSQQHAKFVQCGAEMAKAHGTTGYDDPDHWCSCAKKRLAAQMQSCMGKAGDESSSPGGAVYANGMVFGPDIDFASGVTFGDDEVFGARDSFGDLVKFGSMCPPQTTVHAHTLSLQTTDARTIMMLYAIARDRAFQST